MSVLLRRQCTRPEDWTIGRTIIIAIHVSLTMASWLSTAFVMTVVVITPVSLRFLMPLGFAVVSIVTLVAGLLGSFILASCSVSDEFADRCDQVLNGMALEDLHNEVVSSVAVVIFIPAIGHISQADVSGTVDLI